MYLLKKALAMSLCVCMTLSMVPATATAQPDQAESDARKMVLQYDEPVASTKTSYSVIDWADKVLPVGNGYMGATIFGRTDIERIQLNEKTLWTGGPGGTYDPAKNDAYGNNPVADGTMDTLVDEAFEQFYKTPAGTGLADTEMAKIRPDNRASLGAYQSFAEVNLELSHATSGVKNYWRRLDIDQGVSTVSYTYGGVDYTRTMFASYPDNVMVIKLEASQSGKVDFVLDPYVPHVVAHGNQKEPNASYAPAFAGKEAAIAVQDHVITMAGILKDNGMKFEGQFKVVAQGGTVTDDDYADTQVDLKQTVASGKVIDNKAMSGGKITVVGADSAYILIALGTDYENDFSMGYRNGADLSAQVMARIQRGQAKGYDALLRDHVADYAAIYDRVALDLGGRYDPAMATDDRKAAYEAGGYQDRYYEALCFQYGRYLEIASSRAGTLPANLQGVWSCRNQPDWQADYHTNINMQMNYWPAYVANMAECGQSLTDYVYSLREPGRKTYGNLFGGDPENTTTADGWLTNVSSSPLGHTGIINHKSGVALTAAAWLCQNLWDGYAYTQDKDLLASKIYPTMKEAAQGYLAILQPGRGAEYGKANDSDRLYMVPSYSSEQGPWTVGAYFDQQLIWQLFHDTAEGARALDVDQELVAQLEAAMPKLSPVELGEDGQIKEWQQEGKYNRYVGTNTMIGNNSNEGDQHRHMSNLVCVYPGNYVTSDTPELFAAAKNVMNRRQVSTTGWSQANKILVWARLLEAEEAYGMVKGLITEGTNANLWTNCSPQANFQIDADFGGTAGVAEMLLQSHNGSVALLPALPSAWSQGSVKGLVARGNFEISMDWADGTLAGASVTARVGGDMKLRWPGLVGGVTAQSGGSSVALQSQSDGTYLLQATKGATYTLAPVALGSEALYAVEALDYARLVLASAFGGDGANAPGVRAKVAALEVLVRNSATEEAVLNAAADGLLISVGLLGVAQSIMVDGDAQASQITYVPALGAFADRGAFMWFPYVGAGHYGTGVTQVDYGTIPGGVPSEEYPIYAEFAFTGSRVEFITQQGANYHGKGEILLDGEKKGEFNTKHTATAKQVVLFDSGTLAEGRHTIRVSYTGTDAANGKGTAYLDAFRYEAAQTILDKTELVRLVARAKKAIAEGTENVETEMNAAVAVLGNMRATAQDISGAVKHLTAALDGTPVVRDIVSVGALKQINVAVGTQAATITFPVSATATLEGGITATVALGGFTSETYQEDSVGTYLFTADVTATDLITNTTGVKAQSYVKVGSDKFDLLREKWVEMLIGVPDHDGTNEAYVKNYIASINERAEAYYAAMHKKADTGRSNLWSYYPMNYWNNSSATAAQKKECTSQMVRSYADLQVIATAYRTVGTAFYQDPAVRDEILAAMDFMHEKEHALPDGSAFGNWFHHQISMPQRVQDLCYLMYEDMTPQQLEANARECFTRATNCTNRTGANGMWRSQNIALSAILLKDQAGLDQLKSTFKGLMGIVTSGDGFYEDGSFIQHTNVPYTGGYGKGYIIALSQMMFLLGDSEWAIAYPDKTEENFYEAIFNAYEPWIYKGVMMDASRGREFTRASNQDDIPGRQIIRAILLLSEIMPQQYADRAKSMLKYWLEDCDGVMEAVATDPNTDGMLEYFASMQPIMIAKNILADASIVSRGDLILHKTFGAMDRVVHRGADFTAALAIHSSRIVGYEAVDPEGLRMWHTADGMLYLYNDDVGQFSDDFWGTVDLQRLPGITVDYTGADKGRLFRDRTKSGSPWAGGSDLGGLYGASGMYLKGTDRVEAKKSWFFFDDEIVAVGSGIADTRGREIQTVVENRKLLDDMSNELAINGQEMTRTGQGGDAFNGTHENVSTAHLAGNAGAGSDIGYYFPTPVTLSAERSTENRTWMDMNGYVLFYRDEEAQKRTKNYAAMWLNHGANAADSSDYAYVLLPGLSTAQTEGYAQAPQIQVLAKTENVHAVRETKLGITGYNFWDGGAFGGVTVSAAASVMVKETEDALQIAISDPTQKSAKLTVTIDEGTKAVLEDNQAVTVVSHYPKTVLEINLSKAAGKSFEITLEKGEPERDTIAPNAPAQLTCTALTDTTVDLAWTAVEDQDPITYQLYHGETLVGTTNALTHQVTGLAAEMTYAFHVVAIDPSENCSQPGNVLEITTLDTASVPKPTIIVDGNFDTATEGQLTAPWEGWTPVTNNSAEANTGGAYIIADPTGASGQALRVDSAATVGDQNVDFTFEETLVGQVDLSLRVYFASGKLTNSTGVHIYDNDGAGKSVACIMMTDSAFGYKDGTGSNTKTMGASYTADRWHEVLLQIDVDGQTYSIWIDGEEKVASATFRSAEGTGLTKLRIAAPNKTVGQIIVDNICITQPSQESLLPLVQTVTASPAAGGYTQPQNVTLATATQGAEIRYTLDGSKPTDQSAVYSQPIRVEQSLTIRAMATKENMISGPVSVFPYVIDATLNDWDITEVERLSPTSVAYGTLESALSLPTKVTVTLDDDSTQSLDVVWTCESYDGQKAGAYAFAGALVLPQGVTNTQGITAVCTVTVAPYVNQGGSSGGGSNTTTKTEKNEDGSTTKIVTNKTTGTVTETTKHPDGKTEVVETKKDGTVTATVQTADGTMTRREKKPSGAMTATETRKDGTKLDAATTAGGETTAEVSVPKGKGKTTVTIPTPVKPAPGVVAVMVMADGTEEIVKTSVATENGLRVVLKSGATLKLVDNAKTFDDVADMAWSADAVGFVASRALFQGTGQGQFSPADKMTRAMFLTVLCRLDGEASEHAGKTWYSNALAWAVKRSLSDGADVDSDITREQLATLLYRYAGRPTAKMAGDTEVFSDGDQVSDFAAQAVGWAVAQGILSGDQNGALSPTGTATRAEVATMLMRFISLG